MVARVEENTHLLVTELHGEFLGEVRAVENLKRAQPTPSARRRSVTGRKEGRSHSSRLLGM